MKKTITLVLTLTVILATLLITPHIIGVNGNMIKNIVLIVGGLLLLILLLFSYKTLSIDKKDVLILIFLLLVFISTFLSNHITISIFGRRDRYEGLLMFITYTCIYLCSKKYFKISNIKKALNIGFYICMIIGILGILQRHIDCKNQLPIFNHGICGTFGNSNFFGSFICIVLPIVTPVYIFNGNKKSFILCLIMFFDMIASGTRSAWVAFIVIALLGLVYLIKQKNKTYFKRAGILVVCFILIFSYLFSGIGNGIKKYVTKNQVYKIKTEIIQAIETGDSNKMGSNRVEIWKMTLKLIKQVPLFGCGTDNLDMGLRRYCFEDYYQWALRTKIGIDKAHNEYLQIAATIGIPALIIYLIFIGLILFPKMKLMYKNKLYFLISITIISYLVQAFFNISTIGVAPLFWMLLGLSDNKDLMNKLEEKI